MTDKTYCSKSIDRKCKYTECPRNLIGFNGMYLSLSDDFVCEEETDTGNDKTNK